MSDIADFLLARIADDEKVAEAAIGTGYDLGYRLAVDEVEGHRSGVHIDPDRVLAECEAKRRIVEEWGRVERLGTNGFGPGVLRHLASVYADHPDYREEWRP